MKGGELTDESRQALVQYRVKRAEETLADAELLLDNGRYIATVNRMYYACFYAVIALLVKHHIQALTHEGVKQQFGLHFVKTGLFPVEQSRFYSQLFNNRITGDYDDFVEYDKETTETMFADAKRFVASVKSLINS